VRNGRTRASYFFVLDAFIAGIIVFSSLTVLYSAYSRQGNPLQSYSLAEDFTRYLEQTKIDDYYASELVYVNMTRNGAIPDRSRTLLEQAVLFYAENTTAPSPDVRARAGANLTLLIGDVARLVPENYGIAFYFRNPTETTLWKAYTAFQLRSEAETDLLLTSQRVVAIPTGPVTTVGPIYLEVRLWE